MSDASKHVQFVHPRMLQVEVSNPLPLRFTHVVMITRIVRKHGGAVRILAEGRHFDASSAFEIVQALSVSPTPRHFAFVGPEAPLRDLNRLFHHFLVEGLPDSLPRELDYLRATS